MSDITDFISAAVEDKPVRAIKSFSAAMEPKIASALETKRDEVLSQVFAPTESEVEEVDQVEQE